MIWAVGMETGASLLLSPSLGRVRLCTHTHTHTFTSITTYHLSISLYIVKTMNSHQFFQFQTSITDLFSFSSFACLKPFSCWVVHTPCPVDVLDFLEFWPPALGTFIQLVLQLPHHLLPTSIPPGRSVVLWLSDSPCFPGWGQSLGQLLGEDRDQNTF